MLSKEKMNRINELARASKERSLTEKEIGEQKMLREEYLAAFRKSFRQRLEHIDVEWVE